MSECVAPDCSCKKPTDKEFFCERYRRRMTAGLWKICQDRCDYRTLWDSQATTGTKHGLTDDELKSSQSASFAKKIVSFTFSLVAHVADGLRKCTSDQVLARLEICKSCPEFIGDGCKVCGCNCSDKKEFMNKLAWASERCPMEPPKWLPIELQTDTIEDKPTE